MDIYCVFNQNSNQYFSDHVAGSIDIKPIGTDSKILEQYMVTTKSASKEDINLDFIKCKENLFIQICNIFLGITQCLLKITLNIHFC